MQALTSERAEAAASRQQFERFLADLAQRRLRLDRQVADARDEFAAVEAKLSALPDPAEKEAELEAAEIAHADGERALATSKRAVAEARAAQQEARKPVEEARGRLRAIETEAATISRMLAASSGGDHAPVAEQIHADPGFEAALGAVLGDDLQFRARPRRLRLLEPRRAMRAATPTCPPMPRPSSPMSARPPNFTGG